VFSKAPGPEGGLLLMFPITSTALLLEGQEYFIKKYFSNYTGINGSIKNRKFAVKFKSMT